MGKIILSLSILVVVVLFSGIGIPGKFTILKQIDPSALEENVQANQKLLSNPLSPDPLSAINVSESNPVSINLDFNQPTAVG